MPAARGRHAPPLEIRLPHQRERLLQGGGAGVRAATATAAPAPIRSAGARRCRRRPSTSTSPTRRSACWRSATRRRRSSTRRCGRPPAPPRAMTRSRGCAPVDRGRSLQTLADRPELDPRGAGRDRRRRTACGPQPRPDPAGVRRDARPRERVAPPSTRTDRAVRLDRLDVDRGRGRGRGAGLATAAARGAGASMLELQPVLRADAVRAVVIGAGHRRERLRGSPGWQRLRRRSSRVARARGWWRGARRWRGSSAPRSPTRRTGGGRCPASGIRTRPCSCSGWRRRRTAATAPGGCSPAIAPATGCSARCTGSGWPTSPNRCRSTTAWSCTAAGWRRRSAARRRPTSRPRPSVTPACRTRCESWSCSAGVRVIVCLGAFAWDAALRIIGGRRRDGAAAPAEVRSRGRGDRRREGVAGLLSPVSAEHVHG